MWHASRTLLAAAWTLFAVCAANAGAAPFAYVPNEKSGTVSVIDTATQAVIAQLPAGKRPRGIAVDPAGQRLYLSDATTNSLVTLDLPRGGARTTPLGKSPEGVNVSRDGKLVAIAVEESNSVTLVDAATGAQVADIKVQGKNP